MSDEDKYIQNHIDKNEHIADFWLEVPYNHYGNRGYVDAVLAWEPTGEDEPTYYEIVEVKSDSAIRHATGANEVIRQANKMAAYFIQGQESEIVDTENHKYRIDIIDTEYNRQHLLENYELYQSIHDADPDLTPAIQVNLVSQEGLKKASLHNVREWIEGESDEPIDIRNPNQFSPVSLLDERKEPEDETLCHRHNTEKPWIKPMFKLGGQQYVAKTGYKLYYCPRCILAAVNSISDDPRSAIEQMGGIEETAIWLLTSSAVKSGDISDVPGGEDNWQEISDPSEAPDYTLDHS